MHKDIKWANKELKGLSHDKLNELTAQKLTRIENGKQTIADNSSFEGRSKGGQTNVKTGHIQSLGTTWGPINSLKNEIQYSTQLLGAQAMKEKSSQRCEQLSLNNEHIRYWDSIHEAGRNGYNVSQISAICNNKPKMKTHRGYKWRFVESEK